MLGLPVIRGDTLHLGQAGIAMRKGSWTGDSGTPYDGPPPERICLFRSRVGRALQEADSTGAWITGLQRCEHERLALDRPSIDARTTVAHRTHEYGLIARDVDV